MSQQILPGVTVPEGDGNRLPDVAALTEDVIAVLGSIPSNKVITTDGLRSSIIVMRWPRLPPHPPTLAAALRRLEVTGLVERDVPQQEDRRSRSGRKVPYWVLTNRGRAWVHRAGDRPGNSACHTTAPANSRYGTPSLGGDQLARTLVRRGLARPSFTEVLLVLRAVDPEQRGRILPGDVGLQEGEIVALLGGRRWLAVRAGGEP